MQLIDSHCHLDFAAFDRDRAALIQRMTAKGVVAAVVPGVCVNNWQAVLALAAGHDNIYPALGIHPCFLAQAEKPDLDDLAALIENNRDQVVALGECGLDFAVADNDEKRERQLFYFDAQLALAKQFSLPVIIHHRKSHDIILSALRRQKLVQGGVIHAFSGSYQQAAIYIALGFKLGIGGTITYGRAVKTRNVIARVPLDSLVLETDAPDMPVYGRQGERNSPEYIGEIFAVLSGLRDEPADEIEQQLLANTRALFGFDSGLGSGSGSGSA